MHMCICQKNQCKQNDKTISQQQNLTFIQEIFADIQLQFIKLFIIEHTINYSMQKKLL